MYVQGIGILFRSAKSSMLLSIYLKYKTSALLRDLKKVAASKPIY